MINRTEVDIHAPVSYRYFSWGAVFAGTFIAFGTQLILTFLGMGIGLGLLNRYTTTNFGAVGIGAGIWMLVSLIISLFFGCWAASKLSGITDKMRSTLQSLVIWSFFIFSTLFLMSTALGGLLSSFAGIISRSTTIITGGIAGGAPNLADIATSTLPKAALWAFFGLLLSAVAAALGGWVGRSKEEVALESPTVEEKRRAA